MIKKRGGLIKYTNIKIEKVKQYSVKIWKKYIKLKEVRENHSSIKC